MRNDRIEKIKQYENLLPFALNDPCIKSHNGEAIATDEAEIWKRILNYRIVNQIRPLKVLETHKGLGIGTAVMKAAFDECEITSLDDFKKQMPVDSLFDFIDIDPFGFPYEAVELTKGMLNKQGVLAITSGEIISIVRNLKNNYLKTEYKGKEAWKFIVYDYIPYMESYTGLKCSFFYAYPTSVRIFLSDSNIDDKIFESCPQWMWWFDKYANK